MNERIIEFKLGYDQYWRVLGAGWSLKRRAAVSELLTDTVVKIVTIQETDNTYTDYRFKPPHVHKYNLVCECGENVGPVGRYV